VAAGQFFSDGKAFAHHRALGVRIAGTVRAGKNPSSRRGSSSVSSWARFTLTGRPKASNKSQPRSDQLE
jgi:hypothetical protein